MWLQILIWRSIWDTFYHNILIWRSSSFTKSRYHHQLSSNINDHRWEEDNSYQIHWTDSSWCRVICSQHLLVFNSILLFTCLVTWWIFCNACQATFTLCIDAKSCCKWDVAHNFFVEESTKIFAPQVGKTAYKFDTQQNMLFKLQ